MLCCDELQVLGVTLWLARALRILNKEWHIYANSLYAGIHNFGYTVMLFTLGLLSVGNSAPNVDKVH